MIVHSGNRQGWYTRLVRTWVPSAPNTLEVKRTATVTVQAAPGSLELNDADQVTSAVPLWLADRRMQ